MCSRFFHVFAESSWWVDFDTLALPLMGLFLKSFSSYGKYFAIYLCMSKDYYYFLMNHTSKMIGPNPFENGCQLEKKRNQGALLMYLIAMNGIRWVKSKVKLELIFINFAFKHKMAFLDTRWNGSNRQLDVLKFNSSSRRGAAICEDSSLEEPWTFHYVHIGRGWSNTGPKISN